MNLVEQAARIIAPEAFEESVCYDNATGKPHDFGLLESAKRKYLQSQAICRAINILKLALSTANLQDELVNDEIERWRTLGVPDQVLEAVETRETVRQKFSVPR